MNINDPAYYRKAIGEKLRFYRIKYFFSLEDIAFMTGISRSSVIKVEKGTAKDFDSYILYAKSVQYSLETLTDFNIPLKPLNRLTDNRLNSIKLTAKIKEYIVNTEFLSDGKLVSEIKNELLRLNLISNDVKTVDISGVMRNLKEVGLIRVENQKGRKLTYYKK